MEKWYVYKHFAPDIYIPLYWEDKLLEFNTKDAAKDFIKIAKNELGFDFEDVVIEKVEHFKTKDEILNATYLRVRAGYGGIKDYLYDVRD